MGDDFTHMNAEEWFINSDRLIDYYNANIGRENNVELIYSTPSIYIDAIKDQKVEWPTKYSDMFPYKDSKKMYWTGYYTSRPQLKKAIRKLSDIYHSSQKLFSMVGISQDEFQLEIDTLLSQSEGLERTLGDLQHHDAITGTSTMKVSNDYLD
jgi:hypothetical protein